MKREAGLPAGPPVIVAPQRNQGQRTAPVCEDRVALGAHLDALVPGPRGVSGLGAALLSTYDGDITAALGAVLVRLLRLEHQEGGRR